jgi:flagellar basal body-associated protein FliL
MVRKGQSISINTIIILIIALVVLVIIILFFTGTFSKGATGTNNVLNPAINQTNQTGQLINNLSINASS